MINTDSVSPANALLYQHAGHALEGLKNSSAFKTGGSKVIGRFERGCLRNSWTCACFVALAVISVHNQKEKTGKLGGCCIRSKKKSLLVGVQYQIHEEVFLEKPTNVLQKIIYMGN